MPKAEYVLVISETTDDGSVSCARCVLYNDACGLLNYRGKLGRPCENVAPPRSFRLRHALIYKDLTLEEVKEVYCLHTKDYPERGE